MSADILILVVFVAAMYFIMIRPQQKAQKKRQEMINTVQPGAEVVTIGGLHGKIAAVDNEAKTFDLDAEGVILVFELSAIRQVVKAAPAVAEAPKAETATDEIVDTTADVVADEKSDDAK
ncbi:preprotein translocase subunit YajC [Weissella cibaria]|uniref:preprotein translocase subunit YajC n=1 Tax=Weissella cibaria TaxID=137591 RepID=UPI0036DCD237